MNKKKGFQNPLVPLKNYLPICKSAILDQVFDAKSNLKQYFDPVDP